MRLTVNLHSDNFLVPVRGIGGQRSSKRNDVDSGSRGLGTPERRVDVGEIAVAVALYLTMVKNQMAVADADEIMPSKSSWFEPSSPTGCCRSRSTERRPPSC